MACGENKSLVVDINMEVTNAFTSSLVENQRIKDWLANIESRAKDDNILSHEQQLWKNSSIYKVPKFVIDLSPKAFTPELVSFGPFHYDSKELKLMDVHKERALVHFISRANQPLKKIVEAVSEITDALQDAYCCLDEKWKTDRKDEFLKMMIFDGCFLFEIIHLDIDPRIREGYSNTDPCFSIHGIHHTLPYIRRDLLLIENQLPLLLLKTLIAFQPIKPEEMENADWYNNADWYINMVVLNFITGRKDETVQNTNLGLHALDLYRQNLLSPNHPSSSSSKGTFPVHCAVKLHEAGVKFKASSTKSLTDISFNSKSGVLQLPRILVDDSTECTFLNMVAFEHLHMSIDSNEITSYIRFMSEIVDSGKDVSMLHRKDILLNSLGSDKAVAELFNGFARGPNLDHTSELVDVRKKIFEYCRIKRHIWRANLMHTYCTSPWTALSLAGALLLVGLTIIQTVYSVL